MFSTLYPRKIFTTQLKRARILHPAWSSTEVNTFSLGLSWHWVSRKDQVVFLSIPLADIQHALKNFSVGSKEYEVICIAQTPIPVTTNMAAKFQSSELLQ